MVYGYVTIISLTMTEADEPLGSCRRVNGHLPLATADSNLQAASPGYTRRSYRERRSFGTANHPNILNRSSTPHAPRPCQPARDLHSCSFPFWHPAASPSSAAQRHSRRACQYPTNSNQSPAPRTARNTHHHKTSTHCASPVCHTRRDTRSCA